MTAITAFPIRRLTSLSSPAAPGSVAFRSMRPEVEALLEPLAEISDLGRAGALLAWDERTQMPPRGGADARRADSPPWPSLHHRRLSSDELGRSCSMPRPTPSDEGERESFEASLVRVTRREWDKARRVPTELRAEIARATSIAEHAWEAAREASDFAAFLPDLEHVVELKRRYVECFEFEHPYDALLDDFEPGMKTAAGAPGARAAARRGRARCSRRSSPPASSSTRRPSSGTSRWPTRRCSRPRSRRACRSSPTPGGSTRPCTRSPSGSRSRTSGSRPASTPSSSAPRSGR